MLILFKLCFPILIQERSIPLEGVPPTRKLRPPLAGRGSGGAGPQARGARPRFSGAQHRRCASRILGRRCSAGGWLITSRWDLKELALPHYIPLRFWSWQRPRLLSSRCALFLQLRPAAPAALERPQRAAERWQALFSEGFTAPRQFQLRLPAPGFVNLPGSLRSRSAGGCPAVPPPRGRV